MTSTNYSDSIVNVMLGWLKGFAGWVLKLFNLAGNGGGSPLRWLSENWLNLLVALIVLSVVLDFVVWMLRWRPYWVWFGKKRVIIRDNNFFATEDLPEEALRDEEFGPDLWTAKPERARPEERSRRDRDDELDWDDARPRGRAQARPHAENRRPEARDDRRAAPPRERDHKDHKSAPRRAPKQSGAEDLDALFKVDEIKEDEVFDVKSLPRPRKPRAAIRRVGGGAR